MKEITLTISCDCGYRVQRVFYTNEYGYFEIPEAACPNCFNVLMFETNGQPIDIEEYHNVGVKDADKHRP